MQLGRVTQRSWHHEGWQPATRGRARPRREPARHGASHTSMRTRPAALFVLAITLAACGQAEDGSSRLATAKTDTAADGKPSASGTAYEDPRAPLCSSLEPHAAVTGPPSSDP